MGELSILSHNFYGLSFFKYLQCREVAPALAQFSLKYVVCFPLNPCVPGNITFHTHHNSINQLDSMLNAKDCNANLFFVLKRQIAYTSGLYFFVNRALILSIFFYFFLSLSLIVPISKSRNSSTRVTVNGGK